MAEQFEIVIARASKEDIEAIQSIIALAQEVDADKITRRLGEAIIEALPSLERVLLGYIVLVENVCDPTLTYLDYKPEFKDALLMVAAAKEKPDEIHND